MSEIYMTKAEYARYRGVTRGAVTRAASRGRVVLDERGRVMVEASNRAWEELKRAPIGADQPMSAAALAWLENDSSEADAILADSSFDEWINRLLDGDE